MKNSLSLTIKITLFALWFIAATFFLLIFLSSFVFKYNHNQDFISFIESKTYSWEEQIQQNIDYRDQEWIIEAKFKENEQWKYDNKSPIYSQEIEELFIWDQEIEFIEQDDFIFDSGDIDQDEFDEKYLEFYPAEDYISVEWDTVIGHGLFYKLGVNTSFLLDLKKWDYIQRKVNGNSYIFYNNLLSNKVFVTPAYDYEIIWSLLSLTLLILLLLFLPLFFFSRQIVVLYFKPIAESNKRLQQYNHNLAHEIKTPISSILLSLDLLAHQHPWEDIEYLKSELKWINKIVESLLSVSEKATTNLLQHNLWHLVIKHIHTYDNETQKNISLITNDSFFIKTDPELFTRILDNIIKNAFKYSNDNALKISINKNSLLFTNNIERNIPIEELKKLTDFFYRGPVIDNTPGHWLWLSIVKTIADDLWYKISLTSENKCFIVKIDFK